MKNIQFKCPNWLKKDTFDEITIGDFSLEKTDSSYTFSFDVLYIKASYSAEGKSFAKGEKTFEMTIKRANLALSCTLGSIPGDLDKILRKFFVSHYNLTPGTEQEIAEEKAINDAWENYTTPYTDYLKSEISSAPQRDDEPKKVKFIRKYSYTPTLPGPETMITVELWKMSDGSDKEFIISSYEL
jgi:hypothetical protein